MLVLVRAPKQRFPIMPLHSTHMSGFKFRGKIRSHKHQFIQVTSSNSVSSWGLSNSQVVPPVLSALKPGGRTCLSPIMINGAFVWVCVCLWVCVLVVVHMHSCLLTAYKIEAGLFTCLMLQFTCLQCTTILNILLHFLYYWTFLSSNTSSQILLSSLFNDKVFKKKSDNRLLYNVWPTSVHKHYNNKT